MTTTDLRPHRRYLARQAWLNLAVGDIRGWRHYRSLRRSIVALERLVKARA